MFDLLKFKILSDPKTEILFLQDEPNRPKQPSNDISYQTSVKFSSNQQQPTGFGMS